ncbi:hypothetical protein HYFRA_00009810, partial [Hymenoscyphus fraxineus]
FETLREMAKILCAILLFTQISLQQDPSPESTVGFCRRFAHQSCVIDRRLYIDGGLVNYQTANDDSRNVTSKYHFSCCVNYTPVLHITFSYDVIYMSRLTELPLKDKWLLYNDLDNITTNDFPQLRANLSKNASIPDVSGGVLWADSINKRFYLFGGEYADGSTPNAPNLLAYDVLNNQWDSFGSPKESILSVSWGSGVAVPELGVAYILGGWQSNSSVPGWSGPPFATSHLVEYKMDSQVWTNTSGPDTTPKVEGVLTYIPAGERGLLVYFGGATVSENGTVIPSPMSKIYLYDVLSTNWYTQTATGDLPPVRKRFCAGAVWAADHSSYNIYLYGGLGFGTNSSGYDDVYILTLPSFQWIRWWQFEGDEEGKPHHSLTCNVVGGQMLIIGGTFPLKPPDQHCDSPNTWGTHGLDLGKQRGSIWNNYRANLTSYVVPPEIIALVGGTPQGKATVSAPSGGFNNSDLASYFSRTASIPLRAPTPGRVIPSFTSSGDTPRKLSTGAIVGIAVAGAVVLLALVTGIFLLYSKRNRGPSDTAPKFPVTQQFPSHSPSDVSPFSQSFSMAPQQAPVELDVDTRYRS